MAPIDDVARALRDMGVAPHVAEMLARDPEHAPDLLAKRRRARLADPGPPVRRRPGPAPTIDLTIVERLRGPQPRGVLADVARENGVAPNVLYGLRARHAARRVAR